MCAVFLILVWGQPTMEVMYAWVAASDGSLGCQSRKA